VEEMRRDLKIAETIPVRRSDIGALRDMLMILAREGGLGYARWLRISQEDGLLLRQDGRPASDSTFWHHLNALRTLGLAHKTDGHWNLTAAGVEIADLGDFQDDQLSRQTKQCFSRAILASPLVRENYLVLFTGNPEADLFESGSPISYFQYERGLYAIVTEHADRPLKLNYSQTEGIMWGIRLWCLQVALMDEVHVPPRLEIPPEKRVRLYPVWRRAEDYGDPRGFTATLRRYLVNRAPVYGHTIKCDVPLLLYELCPAEGLQLREAKKLIWAWLDLHSSSAFVEATSSPGALVHDKGGSHDARARQLTSYLDRGGALYSVLFVDARVLREGEEDGH
jgi:hypothetical protein